MQPIKLVLSFAEVMFNLEVLNTTRSPIRIWTARFSSGYEAIRFQVSGATGNSRSIRRKPKRWTVNPPDFLELDPGASHLERLDLKDGSWDLTECEVEFQHEFDIKAALEITADQFTAMYDVLTGRYTSNGMHFQSLSEIAP